MGNRAPVRRTIQIFFYLFQGVYPNNSVRLPNRGVCGTSKGQELKSTQAELSPNDFIAFQQQARPVPAASPKTLHVVCRVVLRGSRIDGEVPSIYDDILGLSWA